MTGASLRDLMTRMGHDSMCAALIYQHKIQGADRKIADALETIIDEHKNVPPKKPDDPDDGSAGQPAPVG